MSLLKGHKVTVSGKGEHRYKKHKVAANAHKAGSLKITHHKGKGHGKGKGNSKKTIL